MFVSNFRERYDLTHTVEAMADLGLVFTQTKVADGTYQYQLEPDLDALCQFPGKIFDKICCK